MYWLWEDKTRSKRHCFDKFFKIKIGFLVSKFYNIF